MRKMVQQENDTGCKFPEKYLHEMGYTTTGSEGWDDTIQPTKCHLYELVKINIENHIKPNVQEQAGGVIFHCHLVVLQCFSEFFRGCVNEVLIKLPDEKVTPGAFMVAYEWMLDEDSCIQQEGILELFNAAVFLRMKDLINHCWFCFGDDIYFREDTAFVLYLEARNLAIESLEPLMLARISKFFLPLVSSKEFMEFNESEICTLLSSNSIGVNGEIEILMSAVRWLNRDWKKRERFMVDVLKCVRFALMPPWLLVFLYNNKGCKIFNQVVNHPSVKLMINDGISFTTTRVTYGDNRKGFLSILEQCRLVEPMQREWVYDKNCSYHHHNECPNKRYVTYKSFLEYLQKIQSVGANYWHRLQLEKDCQNRMDCCEKPECDSTNDANLVFEKQKK